MTLCDQTEMKWAINESVNLPIESWQNPAEDTYFFCDLHADAAAFLRSLKLSQLITLDSEIGHITLTSAGRKGKIIIGGDCFDKGPSNLALFRLIGELRAQHSNLVLLAGNHDIRVYAGLLALEFADDLRQSHFFVRMGRKTASLLAEIYHQYCDNEPELQLSDAQISHYIFPQPEWFELFPKYAKHFMSSTKLEKEIQSIHFKQQDFLEACREHGLDLKAIYQAALKAKQLFLDPQGEFSWFFEELDLVHQSGSYFFSHAGIDDIIAEKMLNQGYQTLNHNFREQMRNGLIFQMYYSEYGNVFRTKYREKDWPLTEIGSQYLKHQGIYAIVNGHRSSHNGQKLYVRQGLLNFDCDTKLNANCRKKNNILTLGEAVTVFHTSGDVRAHCSDVPSTKMFHPKHLLETDQQNSYQ